MWKLEDLNDETTDTLSSYQGLIAIFLYNSAAKTLEDILRQSFRDLHIQSGEHVLLVLGRSKWMSSIDQSRLSADVRSRLSARQSMSYMVAMTGNDYDYARQMLDLRSRFDCHANDLPCLILTSSFNHTDAYVYSFDRASIHANGDGLVEAIGEVFDICREQFLLNPAPPEIDWSDEEETYKTLIAWRDENLQRIVPELRKLKLVKFLKKVSPSAGGVIARGLGGLAGKFA